ncbi:hypothetical protein COOONC_16507, partial [Cooperia oncophora]
LSSSGPLVPDSVSAKYPALLHALSSDSAQPSTSGEDSAPPSDEKKLSPRRRFGVNMTGHLFRGELGVSQKGIHPVIKYPIPGGDLCYTFEQVRTTKQGVVVYRCRACRKKRNTTTIAVQNECEFIGDPAELPHVCTPMNSVEDKVTRMVYQSCHAIATEPQLAEAKPNQLWKSIAQLIDDNAPDGKPHASGTLNADG